MVVYTKSDCSSFDMVTDIKTKVHPYFCLDKRIQKMTDLPGGFDVGLISGIVKFAESVGYVGLTVIENTDIGEVVDCTGTVSQGGYILVNRLYCAIIYTNDSSFRVYREEDVLMRPHFKLLLPLSVLSTPGSRITGHTPDSYTFVDGGLVELYSDSMCARIPACSYALTKYGKLIAVFGLQTGSATLDFKPTSVRGARASLFSRKRRNVITKTLAADKGVFVSDVASVKEAIDSFCRGNALDESFCYSYKLPASLASTVATRLSMLRIADNAGLEASDFVGFLASGTQNDGEFMREYINGDTAAAQFVSANDTSFAWILRENDLYYQKLLKEKLESLSALTNGIVTDIRDVLGKYIAGQTSKKTDGLLYGRDNYPTMLQLPSYLTEVAKLDDWCTQTVERLSKYSGFVSADKETGSITFRKDDMISYLGVSGPYQQLDARITREVEKSLASILPVGDAISDFDYLRFKDGGLTVKFGGTPFQWGEVNDSAIQTAIGYGQAFEVDQDHSSSHKHHSYRSYFALKPGFEYDMTPSCDKDISYCYWNQRSRYPAASTLRDVLNNLPWARPSPLGSEVIDPSTYNGRQLTSIQRIDVLKADKPSNGVANFTLGVKVRVRVFDMIHARWNASWVHARNRDLIACLLKKDNADISVSLAGSESYAPPSVKQRQFSTGDLNRKNGRGPADCHVASRTFTGCYVGPYDPVSQSSTGGFAFAPCDWTYLYIKFKVSVNLPEDSFVDPTADFSGDVTAVTEKANNELGDAAAAHLVQLLTEAQLLQDVKFIYDLDGLGKNLMDITDAQQLTKLAISKDNAIVLIAQMIMYRESCNRATGQQILDSVQRSRVNANITALSVAAAISFAEQPVSDYTDLAAITEMVKSNCHDVAINRPDVFWYRGDTSGIGLAGKDLDLWPYYGAIA